ncbi:MAG: hypothetical protein IPP17_03395 [Bacteroidetes bacterium]|nr:hypothetical protein [Bacteroidota bacterium]
MSFTEPDNTAEIALLTKAVASGEFQLIVVRHNHLSFVETVMDRLRDVYPERLIARIRLPLEENSSVGRIAISQGSGILLIEGFEKILEDDTARITLNQQRDKLTKVPISMVLFIPSSVEVLRNLQKGLPDLWAIRNLEIDLHREVEVAETQFAQVGDGLSGTKEEKLAEIERLETQLREAASDSSTISYRANLATRLGQLHFSFGEYADI